MTVPCFRDSRAAFSTNAPIADPYGGFIHETYPPPVLFQGVIVFRKMPLALSVRVGARHIQVEMPDGVAAVEKLLGRLPVIAIR